VTRLDDFYPDPAPPGTLRDALSQGNRCIVFDQGGTITLKERLYVTGANVTIDGFSAPSPGITLQGETANTPSTLIVEGDMTPGNVVIRGIRHRGPKPDDGMRVFGKERVASYPAVSNVVFDHVSVTGQGDGAIDVTEQANHVTIQWSILGTGFTDQEFNLIQFGAYDITLHHNLYIDGKARMPGCYDSEVPAPDLVCDVRNNVIWQTTQAGTEVRFSATANVINNFYRPSTTAPAIIGQTLWITDGGLAYSAGNDSAPNPPYTVDGNVSTPFPVASQYVPSTTDAATAAQAVRAQAGARCDNFGLDATDTTFINELSF